MNQPQENPQPPPPGSAMRTTPFTPGAWLRLDVLILFLIFVLFYYFKLSTFSLSIDDEAGAVRASANVWLVQGRWGVYLLERLLVSRQVVPFFPFFIFGACLSISYPILLSAFGVRRLQLVHYAAFPLYVAFPIWIYALSFFSNTMAFGLGHLLAICAVYFCRPLFLGSPGAAIKRAMWPRTALGVLRAAAFTAAAIGMYQTFAFSVVVLGIALITVMSLDEGVQWRPAIGRCLLLLCTLVIAAVLYETVELSMLALFHLGKEHYIGNFLNPYALLHTPGHVFSLAATNLADTYGGGERIFGVSAFGFGLTLCCGIVALASWPGVSSGRRALLLLAGATMIIVPFLLHVAAGGELPARTLVAVPAVVWFFAMLGMTSPRLWLAKLSLLAVAVATLQILYILNLLQAANEFARKHDEALAAAIYARIINLNPDISEHAPLIDFYGAKSFDSVYPRPVPATAGYSFFEWDGGNIFRIVPYMRLLGYTQLQIPTPEQRHRNDAIFAGMPVWPNPGSVRVANGMTLVKLGPLPGFR